MRPRIRKYNPGRNGDLEISYVADQEVDITFVPPKMELTTIDGFRFSTKGYKKKVMVIRPKSDSVTIFPFSTQIENNKFLKQKYKKVECITLDGNFGMWGGVLDLEVNKGIDVFYILEELPPAFSKDYTYGLGFIKSFSSIVDVIEKESNCSEIIITEKYITGPDSAGVRFYISWSDFEKIRLSINRVGSLLQTSCRSVRYAETHNVLTKEMDIKPIIPSIGRKRIRREFVETSQGRTSISIDEHDGLLTIVSDNASDLIKHSSEKVAKIRSELELLTIKELILKYEDNIRKSHNEKYWQSFFKTHQFILSMAFGYPITLVQDQANAGGQTIQGDQGKIIDFLMQNHLTRNAAIIEIKRPDTLIVTQAKSGKNLHTPSAALYQAVSQVLDYRYELTKNFANVMANDRKISYETYSIRCCVVAGRMPTGTNQKKSFELFRSNLNNVDIVTYDELLEKIRMLNNFFERAKDC